MLNMPSAMSAFAMIDQAFGTTLVDAAEKYGIGSIDPNKKITREEVMSLAVKYPDVTSMDFSMVDYPWYHCLILALLVNISSTIGDLVESQLKRNFGVKDAGSIMPGHGGLLDRFDGALLAFPVSVLYITLSGL